ncbi:sulfide/dihydroorotate dehydrogenase-like FAD/NAD-binding protein [Aminipila luticellarii]|uniref:Sulfide/dihydroorotate dehydrogenase-like FAD/NAD-binding protein n=1 Tax=Aminipila luticellarii TaxID=2507160 RepID=A0A410PT52_9FIRM|nr:sulfide/dihydroorotate dehydrogenase-like FAD/NAD-binding protein [Aminipila luticellarii]QAT42095.1 sulfide/dihydroorotate dehydrogenase-like FAD/NAD-binding protein [Aminipila luticellarii]
MYKIVGKRRLNSTITWLEIEAPLVARKARPGQFIILRTDEYGERIPLTMAGHNAEKGTIDIIYQAVGKTTLLLDQFEVGDALADVVGPLGKPTEMEGLKRVAVVGGGTGNALAYPIAKGMHDAGIEVDMIAGFQTKDVVILEEEFRAGTTNLYITTDDGSYGEKGFTTDKLKALIEAGNPYDEVVAVGPPVMMKFVCQLTKKYGIKTVVSLTAYMVDGTGMCGGCRVVIGGENKFACVDGPEFDGQLVDWDELIQRNSFYKEQEKEDITHVCRLTGGVRYYA